MLLAISSSAILLFPLTKESIKMPDNKAQVGSISHGTLRTIDLLESFSSELERLDPTNELVKEAEAVITLSNAGWDIEGEEASELVANLQDALQDHAPPYCYFGTLEGDGSDFGFWPDMDQIEELTKISDPSEVEDYLGEDMVFVNDHGNLTVYGADGSVLLELV